MPLVSIITCFFNSQKYLECFFEALVKQTEQDFELIVVNDASTDNSEKIIGKFCSIDDSLNKEKFIHNSKIKIKYLKLAQNVGAGQARNLGIAKATGKYIFFVDSDDFISPNYIESIYKILQQHNIVYPLVSVYRHYQNSLFKRKFKTKLKNNFKIAEIEQQGNDFWRLFARLGYLREIVEDYKITFPSDRLAQFEDYFFLWNYEIALRKHYPQAEVVFIKAARYYYRLRDDATSLTDQAFMRINDNFKILRKVFLPLIQHSRQQLGYIPSNLKHAIAENIFIYLQRLLTQQIPEINEQLVNLSFSLKALKYLLLSLLQDEKLDTDFDKLFNYKNPLVKIFISNLLQLKNSTIVIDTPELQIIYNTVIQNSIKLEEKPSVSLKLAGYVYGYKNLISKVVHLEKTKIGMNNYKRTILLMDNSLEMTLIRHLGITYQVTLSNYKSLISKAKFALTKRIVIDVNLFKEINFIQRISYRFLTKGFDLYVDKLDRFNYQLVSEVVCNLPIIQIIVNKKSDELESKLGNHKYFLAIEFLRIKIDD